MLDLRQPVVARERGDERPHVRGLCRACKLPRDAGLRRASAKALQDALGIGSYKSAWTMPHKIRTAMRRTSPDLLSGEIEVDETFVGGPRPGKVGRGALNKQIVIIA